MPPPNDFTFEEAQSQIPSEFDFEDAQVTPGEAFDFGTKVPQAAFGTAQSLWNIGQASQAAMQAEKAALPRTESTFDKVLGFLKPGITPPAGLAIGANLQPSDVSRVERGIYQPASKLTEGLFDTASEMLSDFARRSGINPAAQAGVPWAEPLPPGGGEALAQSVLAPFTHTAPEWATGAMKEGGELLRGFTEPGQAAALLAAPESKATQGLFMTQAALGVPTSLTDLLQSRSPEEASRAFVRAAANIGMAELMRRGMKPGAESGLSERQAQYLRDREARASQANLQAIEAEISQLENDPHVTGKTLVGMNPDGSPKFEENIKDNSKIQKLERLKANAEKIRRDQEIVPQGGQVPEGSQVAGVSDIHQAGGQPQGVAPQETQVSPAGTEASVVAEPEMPPLPPGEKLVTVQRPDGSTYQASFSGKYYKGFPGGDRPSLATLKEGKWSHGIAPVGDKILETAEAPKEPGVTPAVTERSTLDNIVQTHKDPEMVAAAKAVRDDLLSQGHDLDIPTEPKSILERIQAKFDELKRAVAPPPVNVEADTAGLGLGGETGVEMSAATAGKAGLPPSVNWRGPNFIAELMEAARQLGTAIRSRVTLRPGVLGQYTRKRSAIGQDDKIEVGNIRNQGTVAHEMGHDIDALIWPKVNLAYSQKSLGDRVPGANPKELHNELLTVSQLMRGPITGSKGHQAYRRRAAELIADFFALYAHEPEKARRLAPKFSKGFEEALAKNPDAAGVIHQLLEGKVSPTPGERGGAGPAAQPQATPGAVPARPEEVPAGRDLAAATTGENLIKGLVRLYEASKQKARIIADQWRKLVPDKNQRKDSGAMIEGIGNVEIPGDTIEGVKSRMTPQMEELVKQFRFRIEAQRNELNEYLKDSEDTEYLAYLKDYLPHFYANTGTAKGRAAISKFIKDSPNAKARKLPTLQEAADLGLIPITQDPAVLYEHYANLNWRNATNRQLMHALKEMKDSSGSPVVVPAKDAPDGWHVTNNPLVQKVYARPLGDKGIMLWKGGAAIHPDVWRAVRQMLDTPVSGNFGKAFDMLNSVTRANAFAFSGFHDLTLRSAALGAMTGANPLRGLFRVLERNPLTGELELFRSTRGLGKELLQNEEAVADAAQHGLKFSWTESESYQHAAREALEKLAARWRDIPVLGTGARMARDLQHFRQEGLWKNTHDAFKIIAYHDAVAKALEGSPHGTDPTQVKQQVASLMNDAFGGQEWQTKFWASPQLRHNMSRFFLAPDWTLSTFRSVPGLSDVASQVRRQAGRLTGRGPGPAQFEGPSGNLGRARFWGGELAALAAATVATQYAIYHAFGDPNKGDQEWVWDNEMGQNRRIDVTPLMRKLPWHDQQDPTRYYVNLGKRPEEILGWITHPEANIESKMSRPVAEIYHQISGMEGGIKEPWKQDHEVFLESLAERGKSLGSEFIPFTFSGNQFALSLPYRKGMTKFKAEQAYESVYEIQADTGHIPASVRAFLRGVPNPQGTLREMVADIADAAQRNGVNAEATRKRSLSAVRGHHYDLYFKALQKGDEDAMQKEAQALINLGATAEQRRQSVERKRQMLAAPTGE